MKLVEIFGKAADRVSKAAGHPATFMACCAVVIIWAASGPFFGFSDTWQLIINTSTTIVTFLMVFLIQNTQNRDTAALQAKLDELLLTSAAQDSFIGIEHLSEEEVQRFRDQCAAAAAEKVIKASQSLAENPDNGGGSGNRRAKAASHRPSAKIAGSRKKSPVVADKAPV
ncbi:low affinity iron permease family protein [Labrys okinawensis]|uniref:low affinity iron permease family protein n=1 Tax=Labrys okinawensis TaxID=346911 RepID=UPI0039BCEBAF